MKPENKKPRPPVMSKERFREQAEQLRRLDLEQTFTHIYRTNLWGADESRSGPGSAIAETERLRTALPALLAELGARSLLDIPCGDFGWMSQMDLNGVDYIGVDIVPEIVEHNNNQFGTDKRRFMRLDLTRDQLPRADVVLCRDCLVHLSFQHISEAIANLKRSGSGYLLTTTFVEHEENEDSQDGDWRMLNFERPPFAFSPPRAIIIEGCTEGGGAYADKALGLWSIDELP